MTRQWDESTQRWFIDSQGGQVRNWFDTEEEAHCYEVAYSCDGTCQWGDDCMCGPNGSCC